MTTVRDPRPEATAGRPTERMRRMEDPRTLRDEVRQSLSLIAMTAATLIASIAFGLLVGHIG
jgi:hypothetical protein